MTLDIVLPSGAEKKLSRRHVRQLAKFTDPSSLLISLLKAGWNMDEQISAIVKISQNSDKPIQQLNAIKYLNSMITEAMERSGLLVSATHKITDPSGEDSMVFSGKVVSSVLQDHDDHLKDKETQNDQEAEEIKEDQENQEGPDAAGAAVRPIDGAQGPGRGRVDRAADQAGARKRATGGQDPDGHTGGAARGPGAGQEGERERWELRSHC